MRALWILLSNPLPTPQLIPVIKFQVNYGKDTECTTLGCYTEQRLMPIIFVRLS